ncbi:MAG: hypothetical protein JSW27_20110 [Phycisphaerales bacterium]|nr:MAG: hypothetical protein JSW27_20110 [Phycisphaerales bacterium]
MLARRYVLQVVLVCLSLTGFAPACPAPGDVFREYTWYAETGDAGQALRVGGKQGQYHPDRGSAHGYVNAPVELPNEFDLQFALRAEVFVEKILCHDGTRGLALRVNDHDWIEVPECANIPEPQWDYQHHTYPIVPIPLDQLRRGMGNTFQMKVAAEHPWNWPQNLINGVHFRIYYDPAKKAHIRGRIVLAQAEGSSNEVVTVQLDAHSLTGKVRQVDYVGHYEDVNFEGDGEYTQWHYHFFHGTMMNHLGSAAQAPWSLGWDTKWVPDQQQPVQVAARIVDESGVIFMTEPENFTLNRRGVCVELCKPYDIPKTWVTRSSEHVERFDVRGNPQRAMALQLVWSSWSPGYMNGIYLNDVKVFDCEGPKYQYFAHRVTIDDVSMLRRGTNTLKTGKTPLHDGKMVHGMEVNWPGIMVLVRYEEK